MTETDKSNIVNGILETPSPPKSRNRYSEREASDIIRKWMEGSKENVTLADLFSSCSPRSDVTNVFFKLLEMQIKGEAKIFKLSDGNQTPPGSPPSI